MNNKEKRALELNIFGNPIKIVTDEDEEYVYRLVSFLNKKMEDLTQNVKIASNAERMTLVALSVADNYLRLKEKKGGPTGSDLNFSGLINMIDEALTN